MIRFVAAAAAIAVVACGDDAAQRQESTATPSPALVGAPSATPSVPATMVTAGTYEPRDNCGIDPAGAKFREALSKAVSTRNADALAALAAPKIQLDYGGGSGTARLRERLTEEDGGWSELDKIMRLGCVVLEGRMVMPAYFGREFPDPYSAMIVTGENVPLRLQGDPRAAPVAMLTWQAVELVGSLQPDKPFQRVKLVSGSEGYVPTGDLRGVLDYRLIAEKDAREQWKLTAFIAGD